MINNQRNVNLIFSFRNFSSQSETRSRTKAFNGAMYTHCKQQSIYFSEKKNNQICRLIFQIILQNLKCKKFQFFGNIQK